MLKNSKIFLLSSKKRHYRMLIQKGYDNILWLKSDYEAVDYTNRYPDNIDTIDCIFIDKEFYNGKKSNKIKSLMSSFILRTNIPYVEIDNDSYTLMTNKIARTNLDRIGVFNILNVFNFDKEGSKQVNKHFLSKSTKSLKVLFVGDSDYFDFVTSYFKKQGILDITCRETDEIAQDELIKISSIYDMIISDDGVGYRLGDVIDDINNSLKEKGHFVYLANFALFSENGTNSLKLYIANSNDAIVERKDLSTRRDLNKLYQYTLDCILEDYQILNDAVEFNNLKEFNKIKEEYLEYVKNFNEYSDKLLEEIYTIDQIEQIVRNFVYYYMKRSEVRRVNNFEFMKKEEYISVGIIYDGTVIARIKFYNNEVNKMHPYYREFGLELSSNKGYLFNIGKRCIYDDRECKIDGAPPLLIDSDYERIKGVQKKMLNLLEKNLKKARNLK